MYLLNNICSTSSSVSPSPVVVCCMLSGRLAASKNMINSCFEMLVSSHHSHFAQPLCVCVLMHSRFIGNAAHRWTHSWKSIHSIRVFRIFEVLAVLLHANVTAIHRFYLPKSVTRCCSMQTIPFYSIQFENKSFIVSDSLALDHESPARVCLCVCLCVNTWSGNCRSVDSHAPKPKHILITRYPVHANSNFANWINQLLKKRTQCIDYVMKLR